MKKKVFVIINNIQFLSETVTSCLGVYSTLEKAFEVFEERKKESIDNVIDDVEFYFPEDNNDKDKKATFNKIVEEEDTCFYLTVIDERNGNKVYMEYMEICEEEVDNFGY